MLLVVLAVQTGWSPRVLLVLLHVERELLLLLLLVVHVTHRHRRLVIAE